MWGFFLLFDCLAIKRVITVIFKCSYPTVYTVCSLCQFYIRILFSFFAALCRLYVLGGYSRMK